MSDSVTAYLLLYVDDIILTISSTAAIASITAALSREFDMKDLGPLHYFLGLSVTGTASGMILSQHKYMDEILLRANMSSSNPCATPVDTASKLSAASGPPIDDPTSFRSLVGALNYLISTRLYISYDVQQIYLFMHDPRAPHLAALKRIIRYIRVTLDHGLFLPAASELSPIAYSNADWVGRQDTRLSTSGYCVFLGSSLISWSSKRQATTSRSSAEVEYRAVANAVADTT